MNNRTLSMVLIALALIIPGIGAVITYNLMDKAEESVDETPDTGPLLQQFSTLTHAKLSTLEDSTLEQIENELSRDLGLWVSSSRITLEDHQVTVLSSDIEIDQVDLQVKVPVPPANLEGEMGELITNSLLYGGSGTLPLLPGIRTDVSVRVLIEPNVGDRSFEEVISFSTEVVDPERGLLKLIQLLEADMNGWGSGMARDMEYMLTTLARYRTDKNYGAGNSQSSLNILNEGDVELAFNIALALRMTRWTGQVPQNLVEAIDLYFKDQRTGTEMNPTGFRYWGETEKGMFTSFYLGNTGTGSKRSIVDLIENAVDVGHGDSADILGRYLMMDRISKSDLDVLDMEPLLAEEGLFDPRQDNDVTDPTAIQHHSSFPDPEGIIVLPRDDYTSEGEAPRLIPTLQPLREYMVVGKDIELEGFEETKQWYTNADPDISPEDLIAVIGSRSFNPPTARCGNIPPPPKPPDHDFRIEWEFSISGLFDVEASYSGFGGNAPVDKTTIQRTVKFDFPVRVHTWFNDRPVNDLGYDFQNINIGDMHWNDTSTGWVITPRANATEYFEDDIYPYLKGGLSTLSQLLRAVEWYMSVPVLDQSSLRKLMNNMAMSTMQQLDIWMVSDLRSNGPDIAQWFNDFIIASGLQPEDLGRIGISGHHLSFKYSQIKDMLSIRSELIDVSGETHSVVLGIHGIRTGAYWVSGEIVTDTLSIDIIPHEEEYSINANFPNQYFNDGPAHINPPHQHVSSLLVEGGWTITSPSLEVARWDIPGPLVHTEHDPKEENMTIAFVISGPSSKDPTGILGIFQREMQVEGRIGEARLSILLNHIASIAIEEDLWFGVKATSTGGSGSHEMARTFLLNVGENILSSHSEIQIITWQSLIGSGRINCLIRDLIWGTAVDTTLEVMSPVNTILIEEVPTWTSYSGMFDEMDMMYITHTTSQYGNSGFENLQTMNIASSGHTNSNRYHLDSNGWEVDSYRDISILW